jgi:ADP-heptose:LPS heptosyltransferase
MVARAQRRSNRTEMRRRQVPEHLPDTRTIPMRPRVQGGSGMGYSARVVLPAMIAPAVAPAPIRRVLLVRPRFLGDICLTLPALEAVRAACPHARVAYVVERGAAALLEGDPRVDELIVVPPKPGAAATAALIARLRRFAPEVALDFFCNPRTALWTFLCGAGVRVGYAGKGWRSALYTHHVRPRTLSAVGFHLASLAALGWPAPEMTPRLHLREETRAAARAALAALGVPEGARLVGFHPGARWPTRRWAPERFTALAARFLEAWPDGMALVTAGPGEDVLAARVAAPLGGRARVIADWPLARLVALQSLCAAFVCGDTGPVHTSVAVGTRTLGLYSKQRPVALFPYPATAGHLAYHARAECSPCARDHCDDLRCLDRLTVDGAWERLSAMLAAAHHSGDR